MSFKYIPKHGKAPWTTTPSGAAALRLAARRKQRQRAPKVRRRIAAATPQMQARRRRYRERVKVWLTLPENRLCRVWLLSDAFRDEHVKANGYPGGPLLASQCHHKFGRKLTKQGDLLLAGEYWIPVSMAGHVWLDANKDKARELGLLAPKSQYDTWPK